MTFNEKPSSKDIIFFIELKIAKTRRKIFFCIFYGKKGVLFGFLQEIEYLCPCIYYRQNIIELFMLRRIRILLAAIFFIGITSLFLDFSGTMQPCLGWMAKLQFLPSVLALNFISIVVVLGLTLAMGRLYCSVICPLGVMQDVFAWIGKWRVFRKNKKTKAANKYSHSKPKTWLRLSVLGLMVIMIIAGFNAGVMLLAPYSSYGRIVAAALQPIYIGINNMLATWAVGADRYAFYQV